MRFVAVLAAALVLSACGARPPDIDVTTTDIDVPMPEARPVLPNPKPIDTAPIEFKVLTRERLPEGEFVFYGLSVQNYETLARNMAEILRWVKEAKWQLGYYRGEEEIYVIPSVSPQPE